MSTEFRNAYHFIPRKAKAGEAFPAAKGFGKNGQHEALGHAVYAKGTLSGIIHCTITLECPTVVGGLHHSDQGKSKYTVVEPFTFKSKPAIPATSLKGLISSVAEAASQSAYRVLDDKRQITVRPSGKDSARTRDMGLIEAFIDPDMRPGASITPAERLFGFVRNRKETDGTLQALAGKVRISHATLPERADAQFEAEDEFSGETYGDQTHGKGYHRLKELAQPMKDWVAKDETKYRSATPNFYFTPTNGNANQHIAKQAFVNGGAAQYRVQGQKTYLHHAASSQADVMPWKTRATVEEDRAQIGDKKPAASRKSAVRPLSAGNSFAFTIRFDNLSQEELDLLCFALRPSTAFRHKIGYAKPLGLGSVRIDVTSIALVDRAARYSEECIFAASPFAKSSDNAEAATRAKAHEERLAAADPAAHKALFLIGESHDFEGGLGVDKPVLWVPLTEGKYQDLLAGKNAEVESFKWFQENDKNGGWQQRLRPINAQSTSIPTLYTGQPPAHRQGAQPQSTPPARQHTVLAPGRKLGTVVTPKPGASYRHIRPDGGGRDIIVPTAEVNKVTGGLVADQRVEYSVDTGDRGAIAFDIKTR